MGVIRDKELYTRADGVKCTRHKPGVKAYISGMYLQPNKFEASGTSDRNSGADGSP